MRICETWFASCSLAAIMKPSSDTVRVTHIGGPGFHNVSVGHSNSASQHVVLVGCLLPSHAANSGIKGAAEAGTVRPLPLLADDSWSSSIVSDAKLVLPCLCQRSPSCHRSVLTPLA